MTLLQTITRAALAAAPVILATPAVAQSSWSFEYSEGQRTDRHYHPRYHENGYREAEFRYYRDACRSEGGGLLGLGVSVGGSPLLAASVGRSWSECDRSQFSYAHGVAFEHRRDSYWRNPETGRRGVIRPERYYRARGRDCASGHAEVYDRSGDYQSFSFESCREGSGYWRYEGGSGR